MGEEFDADRIGRRDVGVVADLTGEGALILILNIEIKVIAILPSCWLWYPIMMTKYLGEPLPEAGRRLGSSWRCLRGWLQRSRPPKEKPDFGWGQRQALATPVTTHIPGLEINNNIKNNNKKSSSNNNSSSKNNNNNSNNNSSKNIRTISRLTHIPGLDMRGRFRLDPVYNGK